MPVSYAGTVSEHTATRSAVGLFDVSHLGKALVRGPGAADYVNSALTNDLGRIGPGKAQYTLCCTDSGGVIDDLIAYYVSDDEIFLVPNAANTAAVVAALQQRAPAGLSITDEHRSYAVLAVQGPKSAEVLGGLGLPTDMDYMGYVDAEFSGVPVRVCRTGYTGEHGYELLPPWDAASVVFDALVDGVGGAGGELAGLGARDTLRTEMGYPLHGHELSPDICRCRPAAAGPSDGKRTRSGDATRCSPKRKEARDGCCTASVPSAGGAAAGPDRARRVHPGRGDDIGNLFSDFESRDCACVAGHRTRNPRWSTRFSRRPRARSGVRGGPPAVCGGKNPLACGDTIAT